MPFGEAKELPQNPAVRIFFTGQMIIRPDADGQTCEVFVNRSAPNHQLSVEVREKRAGKPDAILMRHFGPLAFVTPPEDEPIHGLFILAESPEGVKMYTGGPTAEGEEALSLAINLKSEQFHKGQAIEIDTDGGRPSILLNDGIFYTADKTSSKLNIKLKKGAAEVGPLDPFASLIGANIYLEGQDVLRVRWRQNGLPEVLELKKPEEGSNYEIYIINDPLYEDWEKGEVHDEFREYYKILQILPSAPTDMPTAVPTESRFSLDVQPKDEKDKGTTRTPCMTVLLND